MYPESVREMYTCTCDEIKTNKNNDDDDNDDKLTYMKNIRIGQVVKQSTKYNGAVTTTNKTVTKFTLECSSKWQL